MHFASQQLANTGENVDLLQHVHLKTLKMRPKLFVRYQQFR